MPIRIDHYNDVSVVALDGDLRGDAAAGELRKAFADALQAGNVAAAVVDFAATRFIDSAGLETLLWMRSRLGDGIGAVRLAGLDGNCRKIFEITRLDDWFESHADVQAALKAMN